MELTSAVRSTTPMIFTDNTTNTTLIPDDLYCRVEQTVESDALKVFTKLFEFNIEPTIYIIGIISNILAFITLRQMSVSKVIKVSLCAVTVTDLIASLLGFINIFLEIVIFEGDLIYGCWKKGILPLFVSYKHYLMFLGMSSALFIFTAVVRTYSIIHPLEWSSKFTKRKTIKIIVAMCVVIFLVFQPLTFYSMWKGCFREQRHGIMSAQCAKLERQNLIDVGYYTRYYFALIAILLGPGAIIGNLICLILLQRAVQKSIKDIMSFRRPSLGTDDDNINSNQLKKSMRVNKMFYAVLVINTICITPSGIQVGALIIDPERYIFDKTPFVAIVDVIAETFLGVLTAYNFFLYLVVNKDFRRKFHQLCFCCIRPKLKAAGYVNNDSTESWRRISKKHKRNQNIVNMNVDGASDGLMYATSV